MAQQQWMWSYLISCIAFVSALQGRRTYGEAHVPANLVAPQLAVHRFFSLEPDLLSANQSKRQTIQARQNEDCPKCPDGSKLCGNSCWPNEYACCLGTSTACLPSESYCDMGGCCPNGQVCNAYTDECQGEEKQCGSACIPQSSTCCPDGQGGCSTGTYCDPDGTGSYGCCEDGKTCSSTCGGADGSGGGGGGSTFTTNSPVQTSSFSPQTSTTTTTYELSTMVLPTFSYSLSLSNPMIPTESESTSTTSQASTEAIVPTPRSSSQSLSPSSETPTADAAATSTTSSTNTGTKSSTGLVIPFLLLQIMMLGFLG